jgi:hypothetical protein
MKRESFSTDSRKRNNYFMEIRPVATKLFHADRRTQRGFMSLFAILRTRLMKPAMITTNQTTKWMVLTGRSATNKLNDAIKSHYMKVFSAHPCKSVIQVFRVRCAFKSLCNVTFIHTTFTNKFWLTERFCKPRPFTWQTATTHIHVIAPHQPTSSDMYKQVVSYVKRAYLM